jgi:serine/threonine protein kinase
LVIKITDFGVSKTTNNSFTKTNKIGTTFFMAPEVIKSTTYDTKCDVYSFSIIMFQVLTQCEDNEIYPLSKLKSNTLEFVLSTDENFRPIIPKKFLKDKNFKNYISNLFF